MTRLGIRGQIIALLIIAPGIITAFLLASTLITTAQNRRTFATTLEGRLKDQAALQLQQLVETRGRQFNDRFLRIQAETRVAADITADILDHPQSFRRYWRPNRYQHSSAGAYGTFEPNDDRTSTLYVPNTLSLTLDMTDLITHSEFLEAPYQAIAQADPLVSYISFSARQGISRGYPATDISQLPPDTDVTGLSTYYLADDQHNPERKQIWTPPHVDLLRRDWVITSAMPVYGVDDRLLGVTAIDVSVSDLITTTTRFKLPFTSGFSFILSSDGTVLAVPNGRSDDLGIAALPDPQQITANERILKDLDLTRSTNPDLARAAREIFEPNNISGVRTIMLGGVEHFLIYAQVPSPRWALAMLVPVSDVTRPLQPLETTLDQQNHTMISTLLLTAALLLLVVSAIGVLFARRLTRPIVALERGAQTVASGDFSIYIPTMSEDELGRLSTSFNLMTRRLRQAQLHVQQAQESLEREVAERTSDLNRRTEELAQALGDLRTSTELLRALSTPIIPVFSGVLVMPIIGNLDERRGRQLMQQLLSSVEQEGSRMIIIDVTGMTILDDQAAAVLSRAASAVRLLGAEAILVGMRPEVAQALVSLDLDLASLSTSATLESGLMTALRRLGYTITSTA